MTIDKNNIVVAKSEMVSFPKWIIIIILPVIAGAMGSYGINKFTAGRIETRLEYHEKMIEGKADRNEFIQIEKLLLRIDTKLDDHIKDSK